MKAIQYTIRNIPAPVDRYLRRRASISGQSLNQIIVDELSVNVSKPDDSLLESLGWFIGSGFMDDEMIRALDEDDRVQKDLVRKEWHHDNN
jgi:hypothetical protein